MPSSPIGWTFVAVAIAYLVYAFVEIDAHSHSVSDTLITWSFNGMLLFAALYGVAWISTKSEE